MHKYGLFILLIAAIQSCRTTAVATTANQGDPGPSACFILGEVVGPALYEATGDLKKHNIIQANVVILDVGGCGQGVTYQLQNRDTILVNFKVLQHATNAEEIREPVRLLPAKPFRTKVYQWVLRDNKVKYYADEY